MRTGIAGQPWTADEISRAVDLYFDLFDRVSQGLPIAKAQEFRELSTRLEVRTPGSVELKMCNISSVLVGLGWPHIPGLGPMPNIQGELVRYVVKALDSRTGLDDAARRLVQPAPEIGPVDIVYSNRVPRILDSTRAFKDIDIAAVRRDYVELEARNSALGLAGELAILQFEERRLHNSGATKLANRIEHVSKTVGDGLGYDIHSFEHDGRDKLIEVKTTSGAIAVPFFVTRRELQVSQEMPEEYCLARVYDFRQDNRQRRKAGVYELRGSLDESCILKPDTYRAVPATS